MSFLSELVTKLSFKVDDHELHGVHEKLEGIHKAVEVIAGIEVIKAIGELAEKFSTLGEKLEQSAVAAGISTDNLQRLQYAASQNAIGAEELDMALARLSRTLFAAQKGSKQALDAFSRLGISQQQIQGFSNAEDAFYAIQDAINSSTGTTIEKVGLLQQILGRGSAKFLKLIQTGSSATKALEGDAERLGAVLSESNIKSLAELEDKVSGAKQIFKTFLATIGASFAPVFVDAIEGIEQSWMQNQDAIQKGIQSFAESAAFAFGFVYGTVQTLAGSVARFAREHPLLTTWAVKAYLGFVLVSAGVSLVFSAFMLWKKLNFIFGFLKKLYAACALFATNPLVIEIAGISAAIAAIVLAMQALYVLIWKGGSFKDTWIGQLIDGVGSLGGGAIDKVKGWLSGGSAGEDTDAQEIARTYKPSEILQMDQSTRERVAQIGASKVPEYAAAMNDAMVSLQVPALGAMPAATSLVGTTSSSRPQAISFSPSISAPITITVPPGSTPQQAGEIVRKATEKGFLDALRETHRGFANAQAY